MTIAIILALASISLCSQLSQESPAMQSRVRTNSGTLEKDLNHAARQENVHLLFDVLMRHRIVHLIHGNMIIILYNSKFPGCQFVRLFRQRQKIFLFFFEKNAFATARLLLEWLSVKLLQFFLYRTVQFRQRKNCCVRNAATIHVEIMPTVPSTFGLSRGVLTRAGITQVP